MFYDNWCALSTRTVGKKNWCLRVEHVDMGPISVLSGLECYTDIQQLFGVMFVKKTTIGTSVSAYAQVLTE